MKEKLILLDPTAETTPTVRRRCAPPASLDGLTIGLLDIGKSRGDVFVGRLGELMEAQGFNVRYYRKPTNTRVMPIELAQTVATECDVVVEALSD